MEKTMTDLMKEVANPIAIGAATTATVIVMSWLLGIAGFAFLVANVVLTFPGILGLLAASWVIGKIVPKIPKFVSDLI